jgi:5-methylcytosine-specific restriction protein A
MVLRRPTHRSQQAPRRKDPPRELTTSERGYDTTWQKLRKWQLATFPICKACERQSANEVDHILPINDGGARLDPANLQSLCKSCHSKKTAQDVAKRKR